MALYGLIVSTTVTCISTISVSFSQLISCEEPINQMYQILCQILCGGAVKFALSELKMVTTNGIRVAEHLP